MSFKQRVENKTVCLLGVGISNLPLIDLLLQNGARVTARDKNSKLFITPKENLEIITGEHYLDNLYEDIIIKSPSIREDIPALLRAKEKGSIITCEIELFFEFCPTKNTIAVTGSNGKTTTSTIIARLLEKAGKKVFLGGNIGIPLLPKINEISPSDYVVAELSSFQLQSMKRSPHIAVITNITPNHLDIHKSYEEYIFAKKNIFAFQNESDRLIINRSNTLTESFRNHTKSDVFDFSLTGKTKRGIYLHKEELILNIDGKQFPLLLKKDISLMGLFNVENYMAAILAVYDIVSPSDIRSVAKEFEGVNHRMTLVRELDYVKYFNSSIDTSPNRTINTLNAFNSPVILICCGKSKGLDFKPLGRIILDKTKALILTGETSFDIYKSLLDECEYRGIENPVSVYFCDSLEECVIKARECALKGDSVILSPACTSFDKYQNFEKRGEAFCKAVNELK